MCFLSLLFIHFLHSSFCTSIFSVKASRKSCFESPVFLFYLSFFFYFLFFLLLYLRLNLSRKVKLNLYLFLSSSTSHFSLLLFLKFSPLLFIPAVSLNFLSPFLLCYFSFSLYFPLVPFSFSFFLCTFDPLQTSRILSSLFPFLPLPLYYF